MGGRDCDVDCKVMKVIVGEWRMEGNADVGGPDAVWMMG